MSMPHSRIDTLHERSSSETRPLTRGIRTSGFIIQGGTMKKLSAALLVLSTFALSGCATLFGGGTSQTVNLIPSDGKTHKVTISAPNQTKYDTEIPKSIPVNKSYKDIVVTVEEDASTKADTVIVKSKVDPWFLGDVVALSLLSSSIDCISGAAWRYDDNVTIDIKAKTEESEEKTDDKKAEEAVK